MKKNVTCYYAGPVIGDAEQIAGHQNKPAAVAPKETITHHFFVSGIGQKKNCRCSQNLWRRRKCCYKNRNPANIRKWIARFYYFRHLYSAGSVCIAHNNCMSCPSIWATLSALLINILLPLPALWLRSAP